MFTKLVPFSCVPFPTQFRAARQIIDKRIHKLMAKFKTTAPEFYNEYLTARRIVDKSATRDSGDAARNVVPAPTPATKPEGRAA